MNVDLLPVVSVYKEHTYAYVLNQLRQTTTTSSVVAVKGRGFMFSS